MWEAYETCLCIPCPTPMRRGFYVSPENPLSLPALTSVGLPFKRECSTYTIGSLRESEVKKRT